jgi:hypothetical protein
VIYRKWNYFPAPYGIKRKYSFDTKYFSFDKRFENRTLDYLKCCKTPTMHNKIFDLVYNLLQMFYKIDIQITHLRNNIGMKMNSYKIQEYF